MHIVALAWMFVVILMAAAEGTASNGSWLGAFFTLLLYGVGPLSIVMYLLGTPMRRRARARDAASAVPPPTESVTDAPSTPPDGRGLPAGESVTPERKEP